MKLAIASGKGGTGKTTLAVNLAAFLTKMEIRTMLADLDVEEPNAHLFLDPKWIEEENRSVPVPVVDEEKCLGQECGKCVKLCRFKALIMMAGSVMVFPELCHGCGLCSEACPPQAISEGERVIGQVRSGKAALDGNGEIDLFSGLMRVGEAMSPPLIKAVKARAGASEKEHEVAIWDCPPGTSCPVIAALDDCDFALLVTEPTPFGLHDLVLAVETLRKLKIPFGVAINRHGMGDDRVEKYLEREKIPLLGALPYDRKAAEAYSRGDLLLDAVPEMIGHLAALWKNITHERQRCADV